MNKKLREEDEEVFRQNMFKVAKDADLLDDLHQDADLLDDGDLQHGVDLLDDADLAADDLHDSLDHDKYHDGEEKKLFAFSSLDFSTFQSLYFSFTFQSFDFSFTFQSFDFSML